MDIENLRQKAKNIRLKALKMVAASNSSHIGTALSSIDLLTALYFHALKIDPKNPSWAERDRFILSKGHGCSALYATLVERGFEDEKILEGFSKDNGTLWGHVTTGTMKGIDSTAGSLGHGLPVALGMSLALTNSRVFVLLGDGECDEGSVWEAALFAGYKKLQNLVAIIDYNKIQSLGSTKDVLDLEPFAKKWQAAKWAVKEIDGHNMGQIIKALDSLPLKKGMPSCIIAHTIKGKGVSFMENCLDWHYKSPNEQQLKAAIDEIGCSSKKKTKFKKQNSRCRQ